MGVTITPEILESCDSIEFISFHFGNSIVHEDSHVVKKDGNVYGKRGFCYGGQFNGHRIQQTYDKYWMRELNQHHRKEFNPERASFDPKRKRITVYASDLLFCPFSCTFWTRDELIFPPSEIAWSGPEVWEAAVKLAIQFSGEPEFKIAHDPTVNLRKRMELSNKFAHCPFTPIMEVKKFLGLLPVNSGKQVKKSIIRHVRKAGTRLGEATLNFFKMIAGASAISKALSK